MEFFKQVVTSLVLLVLTICKNLVAEMYPTYTPCEPSMIETIKRFWEVSGTPHDVLERMEKVRFYVDYFTSYSKPTSYSNYKCIFIEAFNSYFNFTVTFNNGSSPLRYDYEVSEIANGILFGKPVAPFDAPQFRWKWYTVYLEGEVEVDYVCNDDHGTPTNPLADVLVATTVFDYSRTIFDSLKFRSLLETWGHFWPGMF